MTKNDNAKSVRANLLRLMAKHGIKSQRELARLTNFAVTHADLSRILSGQTKRPGSAKLKAIADALGEPVEEFWALSPCGKAAQNTLQEFLASPFAEDISAEEVSLLRRITWPWGIPTIKSWYYALEAIRASKEG